MPNYDYKCLKCLHVFEAFQPITAAPLKKCPKCGGRVKRLIGTGGGIIFKGSGFYATDYRKPDKKAAKEAAKGKPSEACKQCKDNTCEFKKD